MSMKYGCEIQKAVRSKGGLYNLSWTLIVLRFFKYYLEQTVMRLQKSWFNKNKVVAYAS
jgi:hypothetical protein